MNNSKVLSICIAILIGVLSVVSCRGSKKIVSVDHEKIIKPNQGIKFEVEDLLEPAINHAKQENKFIFIEFYTTWCLPCKMMDEDVFQNKVIGDYINPNFVSIKVDAEKKNGPLLSSVYGVTAYPSLIFVDTKGDVLVKQVGSVSNRQFLNIAKEAILLGRSQEITQ